MQTNLTPTQSTPAAKTYYKGCAIREVPFSNPKQYEAIGRVHASYAAAQQAIEKSFETLRASIIQY